MFDTSELQDAVRNYVQAWGEAETRLKEVEQIKGDFDVASINELRYAGRRFVDALLIELKHSDHIDGNGLIEAINEARNNCIRAKHDAIDSAYVYLLDRVRLMQDTFGIAICMTYFPGYSDILAEMKIVAEKIQASRTLRDQRILIYDDVATYNLPRLVKLYNQMESSEAAILELKQIEQIQTEKDEQDKRLNKRLGWGGLVVGILSLAFSLWLYLTS